MVWDGFGITLFRWQLGLGFDFSNGVAVIVYFSHLIVYMFCFCVRFIFAIGFFGWSPCILQYKSRGQRIDFTKETVRLGYHANYLSTGWLLYILNQYGTCHFIWRRLLRETGMLFVTFTPRIIRYTQGVTNSKHSKVRVISLIFWSRLSTPEFTLAPLWQCDAGQCCLGLLNLPSSVWIDDSCLADWYYEILKSSVWKNKVYKWSD